MKTCKCLCLNLDIIVQRDCDRCDVDVYTLCTFQIIEVKFSFFFFFLNGAAQKTSKNDPSTLNIESGPGFCKGP